MPNSPLYREGHNKSATCTIHDYSSTGDGSSLFNCHEVSYTNGNSNITSDLVTRNIVQTDNVSSNRANNISNTAGNDSIYTYELNEGAFGSRMRIIGNADSVYRKSRQAADIIKNDIVAARSGFNDDRNSSSFNPVAGLGSIPGNIFDALTSIDDDVADGDDEPLSSNGGNLFMAMATDVTSEIGNYTKKFSKISASSQLKKAELAAKNEIEKQKKQLELIKNMPDSPAKERIKNAIAQGDLSALLSNPSNENKQKKSVYNKDDYESKVAEVLPELIEIERQC